MASFAPKPDWLRKKITPSAHRAMKELLGERSIHTICEEAWCPNISECFGQKVATFMILGTRCTRACSFCAVDRAKPLSFDPLESENIAWAVLKLGLKHVVITSPARDDLHDGGAAQFYKTVQAIKAIDDAIIVEILIPDLQNNDAALRHVAMSGAEIIGHNLETVPRLYHIRKGATYQSSLSVLQKLLSFNPSCATKSGIMLGLGERDDEVFKLMEDLLSAGCRLLSIGQYLSPSSRHERVVEYVNPERFEMFRRTGMQMGFDHIKSSPYTRSSYMAHEYLEEK
ncbi:MAG TPA: lipoyl synthase [Sulfurovum sp. UBA12169]|nr:MAG TPA: lipoyl synthase [Sulfurovum sp. UBA12169]